MIGLLILGVFAIVVGVCMLICPGRIEKLSEYLDRRVFSDGGFYKHSVLSAVFLIASGVFLITIYAYYH